MIFKNQKGDTIVEVMIALAVLGSVLVGGYSIATRSINSVRVSQERGEALKIAEGQLELLRARLNGVSTLAGLPANFDEVFIMRNNFFTNNNTFTSQSDTPATGFCFKKSDNLPLIFNEPPEDLTKYDPECVQDQRYHIAIVPQYTKGNDNTLIISYTVTVRWDRSGGGEPQTLSLSFRTTVDGANTAT